MINILIALVGMAIAAVFDYKTGYIPNKLSHSMILLGIIWVVLSYPLNDMLLVYGIAAAVFAVGFLAYIFGQFGGGDVKIFTALVLLIPFYPTELIPHVQNFFGTTPIFANYPFILPVFLLAGLIGPMFLVALKYYYKIYRIKNKVKDYEKKFITGLIYSLILIPVVIFWLYFSPVLIIIFIPMIATFLLLPFKNDVEEHFFSIEKKISDLDDDDVLALEFIDSRTKKRLGLWRKTFTGPELRKIKERAKKAKLRKITVYENMPKFTPFIFIALVINLIVGDFLLYLMAISI